jgi:hypothetical protein
MSQATVVRLMPGKPASAREEYRFGYKSLWKHIRELLGYNLWGTLFFVSAVVIGFIHGWLKLRYNNVFTHLSYDILIVASIAVTALKLKRGTSLFPDKGVATAVITLLGVCVVYLFLSPDVPFLISLASLRGWCLAPMGLFLGYHLTRSVRQLEVFILLLVLMGTATAIYGAFFQTEAEIQQLIANNPELTMRLQGLFYTTDKGAHFRSFSTFVTPAAFGGSMAYCVMFSVSRMTVPQCPMWERIVMLGATLMMGYGVMLSGARTAMLVTVVGLAVTAWYRRSIVKFLFGPAILGGAVLLLAEIVRGGVTARFGTLLDWEQVWGRLWIVLQPMMDSLVQYPLGGGLGMSGHGVPSFFQRFGIMMEHRAIDGDLGRIVVDFGIIGLFLFVYIGVTGVRDSTRWVAELRDSAPGVIALPCAALFAINLVMWPTGSPFLAVPGGILTWFFIGAVRHIVDEYRRILREGGTEALENNELFVSFLTAGRPQTEMAVSALQTGYGTSFGRTPGIRSHQLKAARSAEGSGSGSSEDSRGSSPRDDHGETGSNYAGKRFLFQKERDRDRRR